MLCSAPGPDVRPKRLRAASLRLSTAPSESVSTQAAASRSTKAEMTRKLRLCARPTRTWITQTPAAMIRKAIPPAIRPSWTARDGATAAIPMQTRPNSTTRAVRRASPRVLRAIDPMLRTASDKFFPRPEP